jgi:hypothetical protein
VSTDLEVWVPALSFNAGEGRPAPFPPIRYRAPRNTLDPRWEACRDHRTACDCREAEAAEETGELRSYAAQATLMEQAIDAVLAVHVRGRYETCRGCGYRFPCPTRNLLAPLSWRERFEARHRLDTVHTDC